MNFRAVTFSAATAAAAIVLTGCCTKTYDCKFDVGAPSAKVDVSKAPGKVRIDGVLNAKEWAGATVYKMDRAYSYTNKFATPEKVYAHTSRKGYDVEPFQGGTVRLMYDKNFLYVGAQLTDSDIMQFATENQTKAYGTGDTVTIFLKPANSPSYWEFHGTPNSKITSFFVPTRGYPADPKATAVIPGMKGVAKIKGSFNNYSNKDKGWTIEFAIPLSQLKKAGAAFKPGSAWQILIARYNYNYNVKDVMPQYSSCPEMPTNNFSYIEYFADVNWK
ncbi:MAG: carbohydrate-binding family 9-like protein [Lentisphaeria bacterium]|nr:carbohydrate-binding family 9-like protein [Lentisphaeria bacterium]